MAGKQRDRKTLRQEVLDHREALVMADSIEDERGSSEIARRQEEIERRDNVWKVSSPGGLPRIGDLVSVHARRRSGGDNDHVGMAGTNIVGLHVRSQTDVDTEAINLLLKP